MSAMGGKRTLDDCPVFKGTRDPPLWIASQASRLPLFDPAPREGARARHPGGTRDDASRPP